MKRFPQDWVRGLVRVLYHIALVGLSAGFALSLPFTVTFMARVILKYWSFVRNDKIFLLSIEMTLTVCLVLFSYFISRTWKDRKLSKMARIAGLVYVTTTKGFFARKRIRKLKEKQGTARDIMVIGSTGFRTFVDPKGELHQVIQNCREAKIMLLNPDSEGAAARARSILNPDITPESFGKQIRKSIRFLKELKAAQRTIRLKLYPEVPFLKLFILGDYIWVQHYHVGLDVQTMPKYVFKHYQDPGSLYTSFYQYFLTRWSDPEMPEYDFDTHELVWRDAAGNEVRRKTFNETDPSGSLGLNKDNQIEEEVPSYLDRH